MLEDCGLQHRTAFRRVWLRLKGSRQTGPAAWGQPPSGRRRCKRPPLTCAAAWHRPPGSHAGTVDEYTLACAFAPFGPITHVQVRCCCSCSSCSCCCCCSCCRFCCCCLLCAALAAPLCALAGGLAALPFAPPCASSRAAAAWGAAGVISDETPSADFPSLLANSGDQGDGQPAVPLATFPICITAASLSPLCLPQPLPAGHQGEGQPTPAHFLTCAQLAQLVFAGLSITACRSSRRRAASCPAGHHF